MQTVWWKGPKWITTQKTTWPTWSIAEISQETISNYKSEIKPTQVMYETGLLNNVVHNNSPLNIDETKFSSISRLLRVTALALKFIDKLKKKSTYTNNITAQELSRARKLWEQYVQKKSFSDIFEHLQKRRRNNLG